MKVFEIKIKEKMIGNPIILASEGHEVLIDKKMIKIQDLCPGDKMVLPIPLLPGMSTDMEMTIMEVTETDYTTSTTGFGFFQKK